MESNKTEKVPVRRVGSLTLGFGLMAVGVFFLCYYFVPQFNWELALKIAPAAGLCLLGGEVLYFAAKPEKWKYDFLSVFYCLLLMVVLALLESACGLVWLVWGDVPGFAPVPVQTSQAMEVGTLISTCLPAKASSSVMSRL